MMPQKILYVTFRVPYPPNHGGYFIRAFNIGKFLASGHKVDLVALSENKIEEVTIQKLEEVFNKVTIFYHPKMKAYYGTLKALLSSKPLQVGYYQSPEMASWIKKNHQDYDLIVCSTIRTTEYAKDIATRKCLDFIDAISLNYQQAVENAGGFWKLIYPIENRRLLDYEQQILGRFDLTFITSERDKSFILKGLTGNKEVIILPNGVREEILRREFSGKEENWLTFFGKMDYRPNEDAVIYFAEQVFPKIKERIPDLKFFIVGMNPTKKVEKLTKLEGIEVTGFVEDPYSIMERSKLIIAPLRFAGGIQNKILENMALGKTVVTTPAGAGGIPEVKDGEHIAITDHKNPSEMAERIIQLMENDELREEIGIKAKELIVNKYTWDKVEKNLLENLSRILRD